ncbi:MAG: hypothetical protein II670_03720, partial [Alphaproteobacteria bacterium]|nr:hypothetical protein [Alphaproteobacteria bacterium]
MNKISMLSMAISLMAGFVYAEEAKVGDVAPASGEATTAPAEATSDTPVADGNAPAVPENMLNIDGKRVADPNTKLFFGSGYWSSGIEVPEAGVDFYL